MTKSPGKKCYTCKKMKPAKKGKTKLAGLVFYCEECIKKGKKNKKDGHDANVCEFC